MCKKKKKENVNFNEEKEYYKIGTMLLILVHFLP